MADDGGRSPESRTETAASVALRLVQEYQPYDFLRRYLPGGAIELVGVKKGRLNHYVVHLDGTMELIEALEPSRRSRWAKRLIAAGLGSWPFILAAIVVQPDNATLWIGGPFLIGWFLLMVASFVRKDHDPAAYLRSRSGADDDWMGVPDTQIGTEAMSDLLKRDTLVMRMDSWDQILDESGDEIGYIGKKQAAPDESALQRAVYDRQNVSVIEIALPKSGRKPLPVEIADDVGRFVGRIVPEDRGKTRFALEDAYGALHGSIKIARPWWKRTSCFPSCVVEDVTGKEVGRITFPSQRATRRRFQGGATDGRNSRFDFLKDSLSTNCICLEITGGVSADLRLLMLGSAVGADLVDFAKAWSSRD